MKPSILLASSSPYRRALLDKLKIDYAWQTPSIDESALPRESARELCLRLAASKALSLQHQHRNNWIIGSDQVCACDGQIFGKPLTVARANAQLAFFAGKWVSFHTGICLFDAKNSRQQIAHSTYSIKFRQCSEQEIAAYIDIEQPLDCAGSIKTEGIGIHLIEEFRGEDPNSLIGLPLIALLNMLRNWDYTPLSGSQPSN